MARPSKPVSVLMQEKKSHFTQKQFEQRMLIEKEIATGGKIVESTSVKSDPIAHKEFLRVCRILSKIDKNDSSYETVINRYCELLSECIKLKEQREYCLDTFKEIRSTFKLLAADNTLEERVEVLLELTKCLGTLTDSMNKIDKVLDAKRSMCFTIEKENLFTIAGALRSIPKKLEEKEDPLLQALKGG
jgi:hypothetical protein